MSTAAPEPFETRFGFDPQRLEKFLLEAVPRLKGSMRITPIAGGQSNPTFFVDFDNRSLVLRKQPPGEILPSAHAVDREFRILSALKNTDVPVPNALLYHGERDVVGTPFFVMDKLEGRVFADGSLPTESPQQRRAIYFAMADTMARLHNVDWGAIGLSDFGRHGGYFERQIARFTKQWQLSKLTENADVERLIEWLPRNIPEGDETTISHGDFRLGNLFFHPTAPRVIGVLDWEFSTLGHPLADVAYNCGFCWRTTPEEYGGILGLDLCRLGIPSEAEYLDRYYQLTGRGEGVTTFHFAFAFFGLAVIFEGIAARARSGSASSGNAAAVGALSAAFARRGVEQLERAELV